MPAIFGLFDILAVLYILRGLQLIATVWRERQAIRLPPLTRYKKHLASQASFFVAVPIGVLVHEFGHALATWTFGGRVVEFGYRAFWGYVISDGSFSPGQDWFIALAGTLGSLCFGIGIWLLFRYSRNETLRYFGLRSFRFQIYFSLIYYPIFTLVGFVGDWRTIYDFAETPLASGLTALFHLGTLLSFWSADRMGRFERVSHESLAEQERFEALKSRLGASPEDPRTQLQYFDALRLGGAINSAERGIDAFIRRNPQSGRGYLLRAALWSASKRQIPGKAVRDAEKALNTGLENRADIAYAHQLLGRYYLDIGQGNRAVDHLDQAIAFAPTGESNTVHNAQLYHWRSLAHRRLRAYESAYQDLKQAIALTESISGHEKIAAYYQGELEILEQHAGRPLNPGSAIPPTASVQENRFH